MLAAVLGCVAAGSVLTAHAQPIYRYVDEFGNVTYANTPMRGGPVSGRRCGYQRRLWLNQYPK